MTTAIDRVLLRDMLKTHFTLDELRDLGFSLDIPFDEIAGETLSAKARELVERYRRDDNLDALLAAVAKSRPHIDWQVVRKPFAAAARSNNRDALPPLRVFQSLLDEGHAALQEQKRLRIRLAQLLRANRPTQELEFEGQDDLFYQLYDSMSPAERDRFEDVRNSTAALQDVNVRILQWVKEYPVEGLYSDPTPASARLAKQIEALQNHLNFWLRRYERVFEKDEKRALVFMADEKRRGPGWPHGLTPAVKAAIRELAE